MFPGKTTRQDYHQLLTAAAKANINMLRVWGGGYYESKHFYQLCDQLGIMLWQDFMFACAYYPDRTWFTRQIKTEADEIIKQLRNHPSIVLWCGNNEIDWLHAEGKLGKSKKFYGKDIYHKLLPRLVTELDPDIEYIPTTPLSEKEKFKPNKLLTVHNWDIWSGHQPIRNYLCPDDKIPLFVTEFGLQAMPDIRTVKDFTPAKDIRIATCQIEKHNYQIDGSSRLYRYAADPFGPVENTDKFIYFSQITQARAAKSYIEHLRAHNKNNGVLFWQLNDCAPAITFSAIDYKKNPKALYYYAKRFFTSTLVTVIPNPLRIVTINDSPNPLTATLNCRLTDLFGESLDQFTAPVSIAPFSLSTPLKLPKAIASPANPQRTCLHIAVENEKEIITQNTFFYLPDKYIDWPRPEITKTFTQADVNTWLLKLKSNVVTKDVRITTPANVHLSDNFFDLMPLEEVEIKIHCPAQLAQSPSVESATSLRSVNSSLVG